MTRDEIEQLKPGDKIFPKNWDYARFCDYLTVTECESEDGESCKITQLPNGEPYLLIDPVCYIIYEKHFTTDEKQAYRMTDSQTQYAERYFR